MGSFTSLQHDNQTPEHLAARPANELDGVTARHRKSQERSALTISVQPFFASELFIPRLPGFTRLRPEIDIKVDNKHILSEFPLIVHDSRPGAWRLWERSSGIELPRDSKTTQT